MKSTIYPAIVLVLIVIILQTCIRIEIANVQAGNILPRDMPTHGNRKWRGTSDFGLRKMLELDYRVENDLLWDQSIPPVGLAEIERKFSLKAPRSRAEGHLLSLVGGWGLLQYPLSIVLGILGLTMALSSVVKGRMFYASAGVIGATCFGVALYRSYFTSLGW
ncbi:MAG: hypothetical protein JWM68_873 [Verrucomicrobiales bacterium]|nr:hypothetical protein [Verrucomicrobiales bacterium]